MVETNRIFRTNDYSMFKPLEGNRAVLETRIKKIIESVKKVGYVQSPICVNDKYEVIDGQARLEAFRRLGLPIDYFIVKGAGLEECIALNIYQTRWSLSDFIDSYATIGDDSYIRLKRVLSKYGHFGVESVYNAITGTSGSGSSPIKSGGFYCTAEDEKLGCEILAWQDNIIPLLDRAGKGRKKHYCAALSFCYRHKDIDNDKLYRKLVEHQAELIPAANIPQALEIIERIYNYGAKNKIYIVTEYRKSLDEKKKALATKLNESQKRKAETA